MQDNTNPSNQRHGHWEDYWNGQLWHKGEYVNGIKHGLWIGYRSNVIWFKQMYDMGKPIGYRFEYRDKGDLSKKQFYAR